MKRLRILLLAALCLSLTACDLLPVEETFRASPVVHDYAAVEYTLAPCTRGDMTLSVTVSCTYVPVRTEGLNFMTAGLRYDEVFVKAGDTVKQGDLLVQLALDDIQAQTESLNERVAMLTLEKDQLEERRALALKRLDVEYENDDERAVAADALNASYDSRAEDIQDELTVAGWKLDDLQLKLQQRQLFAPIDGTVTFVKRIKDGDVTVMGERVVTVADSTMSLFRAETEYWDRFAPGDAVVITSKKVDYEATVVEAEAVGAVAQERVPGQKGFVYFALNEPTFELEDSDRGTLTLVLDRRENVLCVPENAISTINGQTVVYYQTDDGMKAYKNVTTGLEAEHMVEIIEGLEEGDIVIAG